MNTLESLSTEKSVQKHLDDDDDDDTKSRTLPHGNWYYVGCFFVTIASVLGTGILGLPVKTAESGFLPFLVVLIAVLIVQETAVFLLIEILQRSWSVLIQGVSSFPALKHVHQRNQFNGNETKERGRDIESDHNEKSSLIDQHSSADIKPSNKTDQVQIDLHSVGNLWIPYYGLIIFDIAVFFHFAAILISYILAGSEAWGQLFGFEGNCRKEPTDEDMKKLRIIISVFGSVGALLVIFGQRLFTQVVSVMTAVKGSLLVLMIAVTAIVAIDISNSISNDWKQLADTLLMTTVALGGLMNMLPLLFSKVPQTKSHIKKFRFSVCTGLICCAALISLWTLFVMMAVPQRSRPDGGPSLEDAEKEGCISTVPLNEVIRESNLSFHWIATVVEIFIIVSISVSYITIGSGLKNFLDGYIHHFLSKRWGRYLPPRLWWIDTQITYQILVYLSTFGCLFGFSLGKPKCFLVVLEYFGSMTLNLEVAFIGWMIFSINKYDFVKKIPLPFHNRGLFNTLAILTTSFFLGVVFYDIGKIIQKLVDDGSLC